MLTNDIKKLIENPENYASTLTLKQLEKVITYLSNKYYNSSSVVDDLVFDKLIDILKKKDPENELLFQTGAAINKDSVLIPYPMPSLNKIKSNTPELLNSWLNKYTGEYVVTDKLDGISALFVAKDGCFSMYTKGNSTYGKDISRIIKYIIGESILNKLGDIVLRGEIILSKDNFVKFGKLKNVKNARNSTNGIMSSKKLIPSHVKLLDFVAYEIISPMCSKVNQIVRLRKLGFNVVTAKKIKTLSQEILDEHLSLRKNEGKYEIDGLVIYDNSVKKYKLTEANPKHTIAYKMNFDYQIKQTRVIKVIWNKSMYGYLIPIVEIEPIEISGTTITYATGHNAKFIFENNIGKGAEILVIRSGDVIPKIEKVVIPAEEPSMPKSKYHWDETEVHIISDNKNTDDILVKQLTHFFKELEVKYLSEETIKKFVAANLDTPQKILLFEYDDIINIPGFKDTLIKKIRNSMTKSVKNSTVEKYMSGSLMFGRGFGTERSKLVLKHIPNIFTKRRSIKELNELVPTIPGFGDIVSKQFVNGYFDFLELYDFLIENKLLVEKKEKAKTEKSKREKIEKRKLENEIIVLTGFRDSDLMQDIENQGGVNGKTVTKKTTILVYLGADTSIKFKTAKKNNVKIMKKDDFIKLYIN